ncbi:MAG: hypothetical protein ACMXYF_00680 [Candidatus Woesearchaeota archaeon]
MAEIDKLKRKYEKQIEQQLKNKISSTQLSQATVGEDANSRVSSEYTAFKQANIRTTMSLYEQACDFFGKNLPISPDKTKKPQMQADIQTCHLQITPEGATSFAIVVPLLFIMISGMFAFLLTQSVGVVFLFFSLGAIMIFPLLNLPSYLAQNFRMKASNQMILSVFYIVTYMRHTPNLERAIEFASQHLNAPLSLDLKKVIWDVETQKFSSIFDSLENYLETWRDYNDEYVESMHVVVSSLYESSEKKRQELLDKALDLILEETYDKMLHYAHNLQSPITALHMLGVVLPILGLIMLPLVVNFMDNVQWYYIMLAYNIILPIAIYVMGRRILSSRPSGYGGMELDESNPEVQRLLKQKIKLLGVSLPFTPAQIGITIAVVFCFIGISPVLLHWAGASDIGFGLERDDSSVGCGYRFCLLDYEQTPQGVKGPFGLGATILSLFIPLGLAFGLGLYYQLRYNALMELRVDTQKLEGEFTGALFQLSNRLGDGLPPEIAFSRVAENMPNSRSGKFFQTISGNIQKLGMGVAEAIFDPKIGALTYYPSNLIESSMKILTQSAKKGPSVASNAVSNVARYIREMGRVNERLRDLMAEVISSMKSQIGFLTPVISAIVIGITSMITSILRELKNQLEGVDGAGDPAAGAVGGGLNFLDMFGEGIPAFYFQIIIGIYVVQVVFLLSVLINSIQNGIDPVNEKYMLGKNLIASTSLYIGLSLVVIIIFNIVATSILTSMV